MDNKSHPGGATPLNVTAQPRSLPWMSSAWRKTFREDPGYRDIELGQRDRLCIGGPLEPPLPLGARKQARIRWLGHTLTPSAPDRRAASRSNSSFSLGVVRNLLYWVNFSSTGGLEAGSSRLSEGATRSTAAATGTGGTAAVASRTRSRMESIGKRPRSSSSGLYSFCPGALLLAMRHLTVHPGLPHSASKSDRYPKQVVCIPNRLPQGRRIGYPTSTHTSQRARRKDTRAQLNLKISVEKLFQLKDFCDSTGRSQKEAVEEAIALLCRGVGPF